MAKMTSWQSPLKRAVRSTYVRFAMLTEHSRPGPDFLLVGGQRCGTTSLFRALEQHPDLVRPRFNKGINYFDLNFDRGERWYRAHFPMARDGSAASRKLAFEASGYYMFHPLAPGRIAEALPHVKIVAMLRNPVERAYSAWKHETARGFDTLGFEEAIEQEAARIAGERERMLSDPGYHSYAYRHYAYVSRGHYASQLREFTSRLSGDQLHIVYSEDFFANPEAEFARLTDFLGVARASQTVFDRHNARPGAPMPGHSRQTLTQTYAREADELELLVGSRPPWGSQAPSPLGG